MNGNEPIILKTEKDFKNLIRPLRRQEYLALEQSLRSEGCREPILVWNGYIVDGHNRYAICQKYGIPFEIEEIEFICKEEAIAWICARQLKRKNITDEARKFLIGMQYETEKYVNHIKFPKGENHYTIRIRGVESEVERDETGKFARGYRTGHRTAAKIAEENNVSFGTVEKYAIYTRALEALGAKVPDLVPKILSGRMKLSHAALLDMVKLPTEELERINNRVSKTRVPYFSYGNPPPSSTGSEPSYAPPGTTATSIKDMPAFDPDASITELSLTIPSWINSIKRTEKHTKFDIVSKEARKRLVDALTELADTAYELALKAEEEV